VLFALVTVIPAGAQEQEMIPGCVFTPSAGWLFVPHIYAIPHYASYPYPAPPCPDEPPAGVAPMLPWDATSTTTTVVQGTTTTLAAPCDPETEACLPATGGGEGLLGVVAVGLGALLVGVGLLGVRRTRRLRDLRPETSYAGGSGGS
jgi:LPXTG-motif cell wall-anchored protein